MLKNILLKLRGKVWFIPLFYCAIASLLALGTVLIDTIYNEQVKAYIPVFLRTTVDLAQTILGTISGALLTMTTISFSTIMVVLTTYSSQFSPRTLQNFLTAPSTQRVLGVFMGGFVYSILSLLFMRKQTIDHEVISASVAVLLAVICLAFFAYFIQNVAKSIQVSHLIYNLTEDVLDMAGKQQKNIDEQKILLLEAPPAVPVPLTETSSGKAYEFGYIQFIDYDALYHFACEHECYIRIPVAIGDFTAKSADLLIVYHQKELPDIDIASYFTIGEERATVQDLTYGLEKIAEVALRAVSPGINDPNTAIRCIHYLGLTLKETTPFTHHYFLRYDEEQNPRLGYTHKNFAHYLYTAFSQISYYGRQDFSILLALYDALIFLAEGAEAHITHELDRFSSYILNRFDQSVIEHLDHIYLDEKQKRLWHLIHHTS